MFKVMTVLPDDRAILSSFPKYMYPGFGTCASHVPPNGGTARGIGYMQVGPIKSLVTTNAFKISEVVTRQIGGAMCDKF